MCIIKFMFDWGADHTCIWSVNKEAEVRWHGNNSSIASVNATTGYIYGVSTQAQQGFIRYILCFQNCL